MQHRPDNTIWIKTKTDVRRRRNKTNLFFFSGLQVVAGYGESVSGKRGEIPVQLLRFWRIGRWNQEEKTKPEERRRESEEEMQCLGKFEPGRLGFEGGK